ncbi:MAG TPA: fumarylacetoacetate hydrolase family protein [Dehalococcoidia bacterium]|jgi:2-dehydro-3-deoxy-D-arabinonate dehydratase|nr:fumarylacetoacetate hydrolase [Chloroflexota bacterium]MDP6055974.1 fumarylacetoacetate hydrolase family protein [Dehalococcoidia bacterium]MDP7262037.1 fumarylacetoacetate hydrolase family protein [Dehalococcoidia bacterium]MDP7485559.1 fumarylacetoacetate hydrolase family protein [Dehalococcoidia bacterium]HJP27832.1 fumarylacetoacetate hydrolase family protein [Dehalococcoidia bacterium]|tara:strand:- start:10763 stop:11671 length:909 start_codon:yes stop_codon:yes gene_type:complete
MRYYQYLQNGTKHVGVEDDAGQVTDLTALNSQIGSTLDLFKVASIIDSDIDSVTNGILRANPGVASIAASDLLVSVADGSGDVTLLPPVDAPEVWAFGVTYMDSMRERQAESGSPDVYAKVYDAARPESFFKATLDRLQPPFADVGIRGDSGWDVPEPELAFVMYGGKIVGFTCGNDMSSRTIEGDNPLYLPQAKVYDKSASLGPALVSKESIGDPQKLAVTLVIERDGKEAFRGQANTGDMKRDCEYLVSWLVRHNSIPDGTSVMTGTGTIPPPEFTLAAGDVVHITIDKIGTLTNTVVVV